MEKTCNWCGLIKKYDKQVNWAQHRATCTKNPKHQHRLESISKALTRRKLRQLTCKKCGNKYDSFALDSEIRRGKAKLYCSAKCGQSRPWSEEKRKRHSEIFKTLVKQGKVTPPSQSKCGKHGGDIRIPNIEKVCVHCSKIFFVNASKKTQKYCSRQCAYKSPNQGGFRINSTKKNRSIYRGFQMDSGAELKFAQLMDTYSINWAKNTTSSFQYTDSNRKSHRYYPDFHLLQLDYWVEIKGRWYAHPNDELKLRAVGDNIELQYHDEIRLPKCIKLCYIH